MLGGENVLDGIYVCRRGVLMRFKAKAGSQTSLAYMTASPAKKEMNFKLKHKLKQFGEGALSEMSATNRLFFPAITRTPLPVGGKDRTSYQVTLGMCNHQFHVLGTGPSQGLMANKQQFPGRQLFSSEV